jgi:hypothetical protein
MSISLFGATLKRHPIAPRMYTSVICVLYRSYLVLWFKFVDTLFTIVLKVVLIAYDDGKYN